MPINEQTRRIAIACQGGGSHTAFTAGVLKRILQEKDNHFEIAGMSGCGEGAICAVLTWYGILTEGRDRAVEMLDGFWQDNSVSDSLQEKWLNEFFVCSARMRDYVTMPELVPNIWSDFFQDRLKRMIGKYVNFDKVPWLLSKGSMALLIGAANVMTSEFKVFRGKEVTQEAILASAAIPTLFRPIRINRDLYWDGLLAENPPVRGLAKEKPDEIWIIQLNQKVIDTIPTTTEAIRERRNEMSSNLSLEQEIYFIEKMNQLVKNRQIKNDQYKYIKIKRIQMLKQLDHATKLSRDPVFIQSMMAYGEEQAEKFFKNWKLRKKDE